MRAGELKERVNVMGPPSGQDEYGQPSGQPTTVIRDWPCSIETLSGREAEIARQTFAAATLRVKGYGHPKKPITPECYLQFGERRLEIGFVNDLMQNGTELELLCGEDV